MVVTIDTNVLLAALISQNGASYRINKLIIDEKIKMALTTPLILEYDEVLKRKHILKKLNMTASQIDDVIDLFILLSEKHLIYFRMRPNLLDENDNFLVECAVVSNSHFLITSKYKGFYSRGA